MRKRQARHSVELLPQADGKYLEHRYCEDVREIYQTLHTSSLANFTYSWLDACWDELNDLVHELERLPEAAFKEMIEVIDELSEARNELRLARFLFDVEEINPVYRLIMRNRAVRRGSNLLHKALQVWPVQSPSQRL